MKSRTSANNEIKVEPIPPLTPEQALRELAEIIIAGYQHRRRLSDGTGTLSCTPNREIQVDSD